MQKRTEGLSLADHIRDGIAYRFPVCCVLWFSLVWQPVAWLLRRHGYTRLDSHCVTAYVRGNDSAGYVTCPLCRNRKIAWYLKNNDVKWLKASGFPLAETVALAGRKPTC